MKLYEPETDQHMYVTFLYKSSVQNKCKLNMYVTFIHV
jgi:hypothetical protein